MKKALLVLSIATFAIGTSYASTTSFDGDPVKTEKKGDDKKKKGKKCTKACTKTCTKTAGTTTNATTTTSTVAKKSCCSKK